MQFHHLLSRLTPLLIGMWTGGGFMVLSYFGLLWERHSKAHRTGHAPQVVECVISSVGVTPLDLGRSFSWPMALEPSGPILSPARLQSDCPTQAIRAGPVIRLDHAPESGLVSVVIPTHNRAHIIARAIESAISQTYARLQIVVADDGSTDNTRTLAESYGDRVTYVRQPNAGVSAARNFGLRQTRGEYIAFLDSDDSWLPWKIEAQVAALQRHSRAGVVWTDMQSVDDAGRVINARHLRLMYSAYGDVDIEKTLSRMETLGALSTRAPREFASDVVREGDASSAILLGNLIHTSTVLFRRSYCEQTGGFDESFARTGEDYEFYIRLCSAGRVVFIDAPSTIYRVGAPDQLTRPSMMLEIASNNLRAIEKWMPRVAPHGALSSRVVRRRFAESYAWLGEAELNAGHRWTAARRLSQSLVELPRLDRRAGILASCALPSAVREGLSTSRRALRAHTTSRADRGSPA